MIQYLQRRYALSRKGAVDNIKGMLCCALQNISFMLPVGLCTGWWATSWAAR